MKNLLKKYRTELSEVVLNFLWEAWSQVGVMGGVTPSEDRLIDPEPLLLLTLECTRKDPRVFDEVLDWMVQNGKWINVTRFTTILEEDQTCPQSLVGAVAAFMVEHDNPLKWKTIAQKYQPKTKSDAKALFQRHGADLTPSATGRDPIFARYGWYRSRLSLRKQAQPIPFDRAASFVFKCRALFGVNMRADVFAYLVTSGPITASRLARELGYSQRRAMDTLNEMQMADIFQVRHDGNRKEYHIELNRGLEQFFELKPDQLKWFPWRPFARGITKIWNKEFSLKEDGLTDYIFETEMVKVQEDAREDLESAGLSLPSKLASNSVLEALKEFGIAAVEA